MKLSFGNTSQLIVCAITFATILSGIILVLSEPPISIFVVAGLFYFLSVALFVVSFISEKPALRTAAYIVFILTFVIGAGVVQFAPLSWIVQSH